MKISAILLIITSISSFPAFAAKNIMQGNDHLLLASCQALTVSPEQDTAKACVYFIEGFLAAAQVIDPPVTGNNSMKKRKPFGLMSRPSPNWSRTQPKRFFPFCIPNVLPKTDIIMTIGKQLPSQFETPDILNKKILKVLSTEYSCVSTSQN